MSSDDVVVGVPPRPPLRPAAVFFRLLACQVQLATQVEELLLAAVAAGTQAANLAAQRQGFGTRLDGVRLPAVAGALQPVEVRTQPPTWRLGLVDRICSHRQGTPGNNGFCGRNKV